jgi:hypothetical protein
MNNSSYPFASVDPANYIHGLSMFVKDHIKRGFEPFIATFLFRSLPESEHASKHVMRQEVERVYGRFITEVVRYPWSVRSTHNRAVLIGCPDWPVYKNRKVNRGSVNGTGIHFGSILLIPPFSRLKTGVEEHFAKEKAAYIRPDRQLQRIHIEHVEGELDRAVRYTFKSLERRRCETYDLVLLPCSRGERH